MQNQQFAIILLLLVGIMIATEAAPGATDGFYKALQEANRGIFNIIRKQLGLLPLVHRTT